MTRFITSLLISCALAFPALEARAQAQRDPRAVALANQAVRALTGGTTLTDLALQGTGTATYTAGSDEETGTLTLLAGGNSASRVTLNLAAGPRTEIRNGPAGHWIGADGVEHSMALHNCWPDATWFYPGFSLQALAADPGLGLAYLGPESKEGFGVVHLQLFRVLPNQAPDFTAAVQALSSQDLYLDASSGLPLFLDFNVHPDSDYNRSIPVEIDFIGYQSMGGLAVPTRIQKYFNRTLLLDLTVASATPNSGLPASDFAVTTSSASLTPLDRHKTSAPPGAVAPVSSPATGHSGRTAGGDTRATKAAGGAR